MDTNPEIGYLRKRLDELWSEVYEKGNPTACGLAELRGWKPGVDAALARLDQRLFDLALTGVGKRLDLLERQQDTLEALLTRIALAPRDDAPPSADSKKES